MYFTNYFLQIILLLGVIQGLILSGMLFLASRHHYMNRFLGATVLLVSLACLNGYFFQAPWFQASAVCGVIHAVVPLVLIMPVGPLIFFYTQSLTDPDWRMGRNQRLHFLPVIIDLIPYLAAVIYITGYFFKIITPNPTPWGLFIDNYNTYADIPRWLSISVYLYKAYKLVKTKNADTRHYNWLRLFIRAFAAFQLIWLCFMIPYLIPSYNNSLLDRVGWYPVLVPMVILIYWMGIKGYLIVKTEGHYRQKATKAAVSIAPDVANKTLTLLARAMDEGRLYLKPDLNLEMLSKHINIPAKTISALLNNHLHQSFNQWVNSYRVAAFKQRLADANSSHLTLAGIALECGFNSQATFQRIFKQFTGKVPSEYRDTGAA
ncbi:helix-turn-helix domain-containing protein [Mucilaginibacter sp. SP1R1]|uniref:helix-turn-helix domain-containing protein n=1 Tax=Mucilaginibacter sp. SP1R1 TaxID=2723091 RepID=UPI00162219EE|nr:AraC-like DNA-binding protein [Mucilaginibacter sp. SP1R1]